MFGRRLKLNAAATSAALVLGFYSLGSAAETLPIAGLFAVTGSNSNFGVAYSDGLRLAAKEINDRGGIKADGIVYTVDVTLADTQGDPARAVSEAQRLLSRGTRIFFCCNLSSEAVPVVRQVVNRGGLIISQNSATAKTLGNEGHELQFKSANVEPGRRGSVEQWISQVVKTYPDAKTAAVIVPSDESGQIYADTYAASLEKHGLKVLAVERYDHGKTDFSSQLTTIKRHAPDILVAGYSDEVKGIFRQGREFGLTSKFVGTQGVSAESFAANEEYLITGIYLGPEQTDARIKDFSQRLQAFRGDLTPYSYYSIATYDWLTLLAESIEKAGTAKDLKAVGDQIRGSVFKNVQDYEIEENGLARQSAQAIHHVDGKVSFTTLEVPR